jgi:sialidase-1
MKYNFAYIKTFQTIAGFDMILLHKNIFRLLFRNLLLLAIIFSTIPNPAHSNILGPQTAFAQPDSLPYQIISGGGDAGEYQAFPDACRLKNGDIVAVFYSGGAHVTYPSDQYPKSGRICLVRSKDEGRTWSKPVTIFDDEHDNRDPHISQMSDGTLVCTFFTTRFGKPIKRESTSSAFYGNVVHREWLSGGGPMFVRSFDNGKSWETKPVLAAENSEDKYSCSAEMRQAPDGTWLFPIYHQDAKQAWGGVIHSADKGKTWSAPVPIGKGEGQFLPAETDLVILKDGTLYAALRGSVKDSVRMHYATSKDMGRTWSRVADIGFQGHSPSFTRLRSGALLLTYRAFFDDFQQKKGYTGMRISYDEGKTWKGPYMIDKMWGAYPSTIELKDGSILAVYYEEGQKSCIRSLRFKLPQKTSTEIPLDQPVQVAGIPAR